MKQKRRTLKRKFPLKDRKESRNKKIRIPLYPGNPSPELLSFYAVRVACSISPYQV
jgi:hypothetical protein